MEKEVCRGFDAHSDELCMSGNTINMILFDFSYFPHSPNVVYRAIIPIKEENEHKQKTGRKR